MAKTAFIKMEAPFTSRGKAVPLQDWAGPEGPRRIRLSDFKTIGKCRW